MLAATSVEARGGVICRYRPLAGKSRTSYIRWSADIASSSLSISWNVAEFVNVLRFRRKKVIHKPSRACAQQLTEVSSQSDEWYRNTYGTNIHTNIHFYIYIDSGVLMRRVR
jgi:hypothetical protein